MQVHRGLAVEVGGGTHLELLADLDRQLLNRLTDGLTGRQIAALAASTLPALLAATAFTASAAKS